MAAKNKTFRVFISSTFSDFSLEREALRINVFPKLKQLCDAHGASFLPVDLRWGVSREAVYQQKTMQICRQEIDRCLELTKRPNFILLLGQRYGHRFLPDRIPKDEFEIIIKTLSGQSPNSNALLNKWYEQDLNDLNEGYYLNELNNEAGNIDEWLQLTVDIRKILLDTAAKAGFNDEKLRKYRASATELEVIHRGLFDRKSENGAMLCFIRSINDLSLATPGSKAYIEGDTDSAAQLEVMKSHLKRTHPQNVTEYTVDWQVDKIADESLNVFCESVHQKLSDVLLEELRNSEELSPLENDIAAHEQFVEESFGYYEDRPEISSALKDYLNSNEKRPLILYGPSGVGKSTVLAHLVRDLREHNNGINVYRFSGAVPGSTSINELLSSICQQLRKEFQLPPAKNLNGFSELIGEFEGLMKRASKKTPLVIVIDALDQLSFGGEQSRMTWFPGTLHAHVHLIVSTTEGPTLEAIRAKAPKSKLCPLKPLETQQVSTLVDHWLKSVNRKLTPAQWEGVLNAGNSAGLPLYLRLVFEDIRKWTSGYNPGKMPSGISEMVRSLFDRLSTSWDHGKFMVERSLSYLSAAKSGLAEDELLDVLSADNEVMTEFSNRYPDSPAVETLPVIIWSRLFEELRRYLSLQRAEGAMTLGFFHRQLKETAEELYMSGENRIKRHRLLAKYFDSKPLISSSGGAEQVNIRKVVELPYHLAKGSMPSELFKLLTNFSFLRAKLSVMGTSAVISDFEMAESVVPGSGQIAMLAQLKNTFVLAASILATHPEQLAGQLRARLVTSSLPSLQEFLRTAVPPGGTTWLRPLTQSLPDIRGPLMTTISGFKEWIGCVVAAEDGSICVCGAGNKVIIYDLNTLTRVREIIIPSGTLDRGSSVFLLANNSVIVAHPFWSDSVFAWNVESGELLWHFRDEGVGYKIADISKDKRYLLLADDDRLKILDLHDRSVRREITKQFSAEERRQMYNRGPFRKAAITPDGRKVIVACFGNKVEVLNTETGKKERDLTGCPEEINSFVVRPDGRHVIGFAAGSYSAGQIMMGAVPEIKYDEKMFDAGRDIYVRRLIEWEIDTGTIITNSRFGDGVGPSNEMQLLPNSEGVVIASNMGTVDIIRPGKKEPVINLTGHDESVWSVSVYDAGTKAISCSQDRTMKIWDLTKLKDEASTNSHSDLVIDVSFVHGGQACLSSSLNYTNILWTAADNTFLNEKISLDLKIQRSHILPGGDRILTIGYDKKVHIVDMSNLETTFIGDAKYAERMLGSAVSADGKRAIVSFQIEDVDMVEGAVFTFCVDVYNLETKKRVKAFSEGVYEESLAGDDFVFLPNGNEALTLRSNAIVRWKVMTGEIVATYPKAKRTDFNSIVLIDDTKVIFSANEEIQSLHLATGKIVRHVTTDERINQVCYLASSRRLVTVDNAGVVSLWDTDRWVKQTTFVGDAGMTTCAISPDESVIAAGDAVGRVHFLRIE